MRWLPQSGSLHVRWWSSHGSGSGGPGVAEWAHGAQPTTATNERSPPGPEARDGGDKEQKGKVQQASYLIQVQLVVSSALCDWPHGSKQNNPVSLSRQQVLPS
jgi:hypothetical protein